MRTLLQYTLIGTLALLFFACNQPVKESASKQMNSLPSIFPDYNAITIPVNIAPLNFHIDEKGTDFQAQIHASNGKPITINSSDGTIAIPMKKWKKLLKENTGNTLEVDVFVKDGNAKWNKYQPLKITVSPDEIDSHLAYRLINVGYIYWKKMGLYQRDLTSFKETPIMLNQNTNGNCMNCHSFRQNDPTTLMFHMRGEFGGTVIAKDGKIEKVNTKTPYTMAAGVYPSWHPDGIHIAYSVDMVKQWFHGVDMRNEVYDRASDLVVYNTETKEMTTSPKVSTKSRETLPFWSPDGKYIYYISTQPLVDTIDWNEVRYDLLRIAYDTKTSTWGNVDTILLAKDVQGSISFPFISPDGKWLMFTKASHGYFTIFNSTSDLYLLNLETRQISQFDYNSTEVDSYHTWSSNSRWVVFSSKRIDGLCTRPFFTHVDENGKFTKPFVLPQKDPLFYQSFKENYNRPEMIKGAVKLNKKQLLEASRGEAQPIQFDPTVDVNGLSGASKIEQKVIH
jgi:hypothetical protein